MGVTRFLGPVYGAKSCLFSAGPLTGSTGATTTLIMRTIVPNYETWYITEMGVSASTNSSVTGFKLKVKGTSTDATNPTVGPDPSFPTGNPGTPITLTTGASTVGFNLVASPASPTPGEFEGYAAPGNSSIRLVSSAVNAPSNLFIRVFGYVRYLDSTRAV